MNENENYEITDDEKEAYYKQCNIAALNNDEFLQWWSKQGLSQNLIVTYGIGLDMESNPATAPWGQGYSYKKAPRAIFPVSNDYYATFALTHDIDVQYKYCNPKKAHVDVWNKQTLWDGHPFVVVTEGVLDALSVIEAGGFAVALNGVSDKVLKSYLHDRRIDSEIILCLGDNWSSDGAERKLESALKAMGFSVKIHSLAGNSTSIRQRLAKSPDKLKREIQGIAEEAQNAIRNSGKNVKSTPQIFDGIMRRGTLEASVAAIIKASGMDSDYERGCVSADGISYMPDYFIYEVVVVGSYGHADKRTVVFEVKGDPNDPSVIKPQNLSKDVSTYLWTQFVPGGNLEEVVQRFKRQFYLDMSNELDLPSFSLVGINGESKAAFPYISQKGVLTIADPADIANTSLLGQNVMNGYYTMKMYEVAQNADWGRYNTDRVPEKLAKKAREEILGFKKSPLRLVENG